MKGKGIDLEPFGKDEDGWLMFRNSEGDIFRVRESAGKFEIKFDRSKYEVKEFYNVESTGDVVLDIVPKKKEGQDGGAQP